MSPKYVETVIHNRQNVVLIVITGGWELHTAVLNLMTVGADLTKGLS